jgi:hypothetical protein
VIRVFLFSISPKRTAYPQALTVAGEAGTESSPSACTTNCGPRSSGAPGTSPYVLAALRHTSSPLPTVLRAHIDICHPGAPIHVSRGLSLEWPWVMQSRCAPELDTWILTTFRCGDRKTTCLCGNASAACIRRITVCVLKMHMHRQAFARHVCQATQRITLLDTLCSLHCSCPCMPMHAAWMSRSHVPLLVQAPGCAFLHCIQHVSLRCRCGRSGVKNPVMINCESVRLL